MKEQLIVIQAASDPDSRVSDFFLYSFLHNKIVDGPFSDFNAAKREVHSWSELAQSWDVNKLACMNDNQISISGQIVDGELGDLYFYFVTVWLGGKEAPADLQPLNRYWLFNASHYLVLTMPTPEKAQSFIKPRDHPKQAGTTSGLGNS